MSKRLYRFFDDVRWAEQMVLGSLRFRTLAYFRDYEDGLVRGDEHEGTSVTRPDSGLEITNKSQGLSSIEPNTAFESQVKGGEIFVYCLSGADTPRIRREFNARASVVVSDVPEFCRRAQNAIAGATFGGRPGREQIGHPVEYYDPAKPPAARWACPDLIACSKFERFGWQHEFRLLYSKTDALKFENVGVSVVVGAPKRVPDISQHHAEVIELGDLSDIATLDLC